MACATLTGRCQCACRHARGEWSLAFAQAALCRVCAHHQNIMLPPVLQKYLKLQLTSCIAISSFHKDLSWVLRAFEVLKLSFLYLKIYLWELRRETKISNSDARPSCGSLIIYSRREGCC